jgi:hypothetical protein
MNLLYPAATSEQVSAVASRKCMEEMVREEWTVLTLRGWGEAQKKPSPIEGPFSVTVPTDGSPAGQRGFIPCGVGGSIEA